VGDAERFEAVCRAMGDPAFYPHPVLKLERRETHISVVFLTGEWVYKIKKPVALGFLDFRNLEDRRRFCERELSLNRRLSRGVYQDVVAVRESDGNGFTLHGRGRIVEYAVKMRQLPEASSLEQCLIKEAKVGLQDMRDLGRRLAAFYKTGQRDVEIDRYGRRDIIAFNMEENFRQLEPVARDLLDLERWEFLCQVSRTFLEHHYDLFEHRIKAGRVCDGHGDLRADHIYFYDGVQIIDCIEFNDRFRYGDAVSDLAFLHMDLEHLNRPAWSGALLAGYVEEAQDPELYALIDFYATYRAIVRLKVTALRLQQVRQAQRESLAQEARRYMAQAYRYAMQFGRATLWVFCGLPATGKSHLAKMVSEALWIPVFQSDRVRKQSGFGRPDVVGYAQGPYRPGMRQQVYAHMLGLAQDMLKAGRSAILDATFSRRGWRQSARQLAIDWDANLVFVECVCPEETIRSRLKKRAKEFGLSDARLEHLPQMMAEFEPVVEPEPQYHLVIQTEQPANRALTELLSQGYDRRRRQVSDRIARG